MNEKSPPRLFDTADESLVICRREAWLVFRIWLIQSAVMVGLFLLLGYNRTDDQFGYPLGLPTWLWLGGIIPAFVFLGVIIYVVKRYFTEIDLT